MVELEHKQLIFKEKVEEGKNVKYSFSDAEELTDIDLPLSFLGEQFAAYLEGTVDLRILG